MKEKHTAYFYSPFWSMRASHTANSATPPPPEALIAWSTAERHLEQGPSMGFILAAPRQWRDCSCQLPRSSECTLGSGRSHKERENRGVECAQHSTAQGSFFSCPPLDCTVSPFTILFSAFSCYFLGFVEMGEGFTRGTELRFDGEI